MTITDEQLRAHSNALLRRPPGTPGPKPQGDAVLEGLADLGETTAEALAEWMGMHPTTARRWLLAMWCRGWVERREMARPPGKGGRMHFLWRLK